MKRGTAVCLLIAFVAVGSVWSYDFGGTLDNTTGYFTNGTPPFDQTDKLALWFNSPLGKHLFFDAQISGDFQNQESYGGGYVGLYADLDRLSVHGQFSQVANGPSLLTFDAGRFYLSDPTGDIYNQSIDGIRASFGYPLVTLTTAVGYTGLTIKPSSTVVMSKADLTGLIDTSQYFGSPRLIGELSIVAPSIFLQQDLTVTALVQEDLRPLFKNNALVSAGTTTYSGGEGGPLDTQYFTVGLSGPLAATLYWNGSATLETGRMLSYLSSNSTYTYEPIIAYLATAGVHYFKPELLKMALGFDVTLASGDKDFSTFYEGNTSGPATQFTPVTTSSVAAVFSPQLANIAVADLSFSIKPLSSSKNRYLSNLQTKLDVIPFLRPTPGPVSTGGVLTKYNDNNTQAYLGSEIDATINYRPFSDLGVAISGGVFFPNASAFATGTDSLQYGGKMEVSFSF